MANWIYELELQVHRRGREIAVIHDGRTKTFDELNRDACAFANWLKDRGRARVAMYLPNVYEFYIAQFGALKAGAFGVPLNHMWAREIIHYVLNDSEADVLVTLVQDLPLAQAAAAGTHVKDVVVIGGSADGATDLAEILATQPDIIESAPKNDDDLFNIMYTSGSTGNPKGVMKSHRNMGIQIQALMHVWKLGPSDRWVCAGPLYHTTGLESSSLPVLNAGGSVVLIKWEVERFFEHVHRYRPTGAYIAGSMVTDIANYPEPSRWDLSSLRYVVTGGAPLSERDARVVGDRYAFVLTERLGMTEAGIIFTYPVGQPGVFTPREELPFHIYGNCGKPLYNQLEYRLIDPATGQEVQVGEGELQLKGDSLFQGYWKQPELTRKAFTEDGWYRAGDIVRRDEQGFVWHERRRDDIIISGGENVSPRAIERVVGAHPAVLECAVFALPHERWGQEVCIAVVSRAGSEPTEAELLEYCKTSGKLARYEVPKRVFFRDSLPKTSTQKVQRGELTKTYTVPETASQ